MQYLCFLPSFLELHFLFLMMYISGYLGNKYLITFPILVAD